MVNLRDSLARHDARAVQGLAEAADRSRTDDPRDPYRRLRLGFIQLRLGELGERDRVARAATEFERATELAPTWPWTWYGLGLARAARGESSIIGIENIRQWLNTDHLSAAADAFRRAGAVDRGFAPAAVALGTVALAQRINPELLDARAALAAAESAGAGGAGEPLVSLVRGRIERELGEGEAALAAFGRALTAGADSGVTLFELSRAQYFVKRQDEGFNTYFGGADAATSPAAVELYRQDIALVASPPELAAFDRLAGAAERAGWLREFWRSRDRLERWPDGERLTEHRRRWFYAQRHFRLVSTHRRQADVAERYRRGDGNLDDRGVVYMRHGEPDVTATYANVEANESWRFERPDGAFVVHFVARGRVTDYRLVESLLEVFGAGAAVTLQADADAEPSRAVIELFESRAFLAPVYHRLGAAVAFTPQLLTDEREVGRRGLRIATTTDSHPRR